MRYYKNLDFLRFVAVLLVLFQHWLFHDALIDLGAIGVTIFFVLSGFLITKILLQNKKDIDLGHYNTKTVFYNFYVRRSLRIFPIYFLLLGVLIFFHHPQTEGNVFWLLTYTSNIKMFIDQEWMGTLGPLWSLAVEEQFYFIWPAIILLNSSKNLKNILILFVALGPVLRLISMGLGVYLYDNVDLKISSTVLMPSNLDLFAIVGILAYDTFYETNILKVTKKSLLIISFIAYLIILQFPYSVFYHTFFVLIIAVWSYVIISFLITERNNKLNILFQFKPIAFLGKISYGLYLYHGPIFFIIALMSFIEFKIFNKNLVLSIFQDATRFVFFKHIGFLIIISAISWYILEKPINNLKKYFK